MIENSVNDRGGIQSLDLEREICSTSADVTRCSTGTMENTLNPDEANEDESMSR